MARSDRFLWSPRSLPHLAPLGSDGAIRFSTSPLREGFERSHGVDCQHHARGARSASDPLCPCGRHAGGGDPCHGTGQFAGGPASSCVAASGLGPPGLDRVGCGLGRAVPPSGTPSLPAAAGWTGRAVGVVDGAAVAPLVVSSSATGVMDDGQRVGGFAVGRRGHGSDSALPTSDAYSAIALSVSCRDGGHQPTIGRL